MYSIVPPMCSISSMTRFFTAVSMVFVLWPVAACASPPDPPQADAKSTPAAKTPLGAWAAMDASISRQRTAVCHQASVPEAAGVFFVLPPPEPMRPILALPATAAPECVALGEAELQPLVEEAARQAGVEPAWLATVLRQKSGGRPCALSPAGAQGLMQLMPATAQELGVADPFDPRENLGAGARRLKQMLDRAGGDQARALAGYDADAGPKRPDEVVTPAPPGASTGVPPPVTPAVAPAVTPAVPAATTPAPPTSVAPTAPAAPPPNSKSDATGR
jgi:soluble lytic murein transglycosylase-like protein